jgi:NAD(P)-dependent dehydrogenase (short-subunit alcohol dehydrogenase family)
VRTLTGRVALVTGASRGLGRQVALELARAGADVAVLARTAAAGGRLPGTVPETAAAVEALGRRALPLVCDVTDDGAVAIATRRVLDEWGGVDILVNNAGAVFAGGFLTMEPRRFDLLWRLNVRAPFVLMQRLVPSMIERGGGHVINVVTLSSQVRGREVPLGYAGYTATKAALARFSLAAALELREHGVAVNALAPTGLVETEGWQLVGGGAGLPNREPAEYLGRAAAWIAAQDPRRVTGHLLDSQAVLVAAGEFPAPELTWADLPTVDVGPLVAGPPPPS